MKIEQIYTGCLAQGAYYIQSNGEAIIIDPLREIKPYIEKAKKDKVTIKYIFETHFHADFVSGHVDLAKETGATIVYGPTDAKLGFEAKIAKDNETLTVGNISFKVLHTPGHTLESSCFLMLDENKKPHSIYTGDTLFIGDVGRPDLAQNIASDLTQDKLAGMLFDSLRDKIMPLPDSIIVYPAHGAGSACGKNMSKETFDTLGNQKQSNYALRANMTKEEFIQEVTDGLATPPNYFPLNVKMNIEGAGNLEAVLNKGLTAYSPVDFEKIANETDALILDTRNQQVFKDGFIPNSIFIGIDGGFAPWVGTLITDIQQKILLVVEEGREEEVITRLSRVGYDHTIGYLKGGFEAWKEVGKEIETIESITAEEASKRLSTDECTIIDIRKENEFKAKHIENAIHAPLDYINESMQSLNKEKTNLIHCAGGYRSMIFCSIMKSRGIDNVIDIKGGFKAISESEKFILTDFVCPSTLK